MNNKLRNILVNLLGPRTDQDSLSKVTSKAKYIEGWLQQRTSRLNYSDPGLTVITLINLRPLFSELVTKQARYISAEFDPNYFADNQHSSS